MRRSKLARLAAAADPLLVSFCNGSIAAYLIACRPDAAYEGACFQWFREHHPRSLYIDQVAVGSDWRRGCVASELYAELEIAARERRWTSPTGDGCRSRFARSPRSF